MPGEPEPPIVGEHCARDQLLTWLAPALIDTWPDHPKGPDNLAAFLDEAVSRISVSAGQLFQEEGYVPAASFIRQAREQFFEHLQVELQDVRGGVETENLWRAFENLEATAPIKHLTQAGLRIKLRALGAFLLGKPGDRKDEMSASEFFPTGEWERVRDAEVCEVIRREQGLTNKQIAHVTLTRPLPEEREIYESAGHRPQIERIVLIFRQFTEAVDTRLVPEWWSDWFREFSNGIE